MSITCVQSIVNADPAIILKYMIPDSYSEEEQILTSRTGGSAMNDSSLESLLKNHESKKAEISTLVEDAEASEVFNDWLEEIAERQKSAAVVYYEPTNPLSSYEETGEEDGPKEEHSYKNSNGNSSLYVISDENAGIDYLFVPRGVSVQRVSQNVLGPNVLGRTWLGTGFIEILDSLYGDAFQEVLLHEINHLLYPHENEAEIRDRTRRQVNYPMFH